MGELVSVALHLKREGATKVTISPDGSLTVEWAKPSAAPPPPKPRIGGETEDREPDDFLFLAST